MSRSALFCAALTLTLPLLGGCAQSAVDVATERLQSTAIGFQTDLSAALSSVVRTRPTERQLDQIMKHLPDNAVVVGSSDGSRSLEVAHVAQADTSGGWSSQQATVIGCFRYLVSWQQVSMQPIDCRSELIGTQQGLVLPASDLEAAPDVRVSHRPCYGGEPPDDPDCPGG